MRPSLTILLILFSLAVFCQQHTPVGEANSYTLTEADGYPGSNYISGFEYAPSGKVYAKDFFGNLHITGNNFIKRVPGLENISNNSNLRIGPGNEVWFIDEAQNISVIRNDTLRQTIKYPGKNYFGVLSTSTESASVLAIEAGNKKLLFWEFRDHQWKVKFELPFNTDVKYNYINGYLTKSGRL